MLKNNDSLLEEKSWLKNTACIHVRYKKNPPFSTVPVWIASMKTEFQNVRSLFSSQISFAIFASLHYQ